MTSCYPDRQVCDDSIELRTIMMIDEGGQDTARPSIMRDCKMVAVGSVLSAPDRDLPGCQGPRAIFRKLNVAESSTSNELIWRAK